MKYFIGKDTNIIVKDTNGDNTYSGIIAGGEANTKDIVVSNLVCYNPTSLATTLYNPINAASVVGTDNQAAVNGEDYVLYSSATALQTAKDAGELSAEFIALLTTAGITLN